MMEERVNEGRSRVESTEMKRQPAISFRQVLLGTSAFLALQYIYGIWKLVRSSGAMANKFSTLAREEYLGFLILQNLQMGIAYLCLAGVAAFIIHPWVNFLALKTSRPSLGRIVLLGALLTFVLHSYFTLRLIDTRPYFLNEAEFGHWYYRALDLIPIAIKPASLFMLFGVLPVVVVLSSSVWQARRFGRPGWIVLGGVCSILLVIWLLKSWNPKPRLALGGDEVPTNVIIIGSDSLRGDRLGCAGYVPARNDGLAAAGVSPAIDALAARSSRFESCYTSIASTMESGIQLMSSTYPHTHGIRQMYPTRSAVEGLKKRVTPLPELLNRRGYDTAAIGDWCAGYYEVAPLGMRHLSVSTYDNFKIYMSQAVVMAHFVVPLYFDNSLGYKIFPQLESFAQFVTPDVVTDRVTDRLAEVAAAKQPFFWHVFYSCNHLPYRSREPYRSMFSDPKYEGPNRNGVAFDIDEFIGGTDLESKWKALTPREVKQIRALYDGCTRQFDDCVAKIVASLKSNGLEKKTILVITSDHGDDLYESGVTLGHGLTFNGGLRANHVPMIVHLPGAEPQVIPETVRLIDVVPTLAELLDQQPSPNWEGKSFAPWIRQTEKPVFRPFYGETGFPFIQFKVAGVDRPSLPPMTELTYIDPDYNYQFVLKKEFLAPLIAAKQRCLKTRNWKLVCTPTAQGSRHFSLYHFASDPEGERDVAEQRPEILAPMRAALVRWTDESVEMSIEDIFPAGEPS